VLCLSVSRGEGRIISDSDFSNVFDDGRSIFHGLGFWMTVITENTAVGSRFEF